MMKLGNIGQLGGIGRYTLLVNYIFLSVSYNDREALDRGGGGGVVPKRSVTRLPSDYKKKQQKKREREREREKRERKNSKCSCGIFTLVSSTVQVTLVVRLTEILYLFAVLFPSKKVERTDR